MAYGVEYRKCDHRLGGQAYLAPREKNRCKPILRIGPLQNLGNTPDLGEKKGKRIKAG